ncbi:hypothetical protein L3V83_10985 [Thiotrichales bacterium 19X7-9]|nr:hypothetical protein [Thiotrichales bacterium 19X7-9]
MTKFHKAYFISLHGESNEANRHDVSYFAQADRDLSKNQTIDMYTSHRRKTLLNHVIPLIQINFPYKDRCSDSTWDISQEQSNKEIADQMLKSALEGAEPFTRIYINAHGSRSDELLQNNDHLSQKIHHPQAQENLEVQLTAKDIADMLKKSLPEHAKNNLQIRLLACEPKGFASQLMLHLHINGFKNTSVVYYQDKGIRYHPDDSSSNPNYKLPDYTSQSRYDSGRYSSIFNIPIQRKSFAESDKGVFHNYDGNISEADYRKFKKSYMDNPLYDHISSKELGFEVTTNQEKALLIKNRLLRDINSIIDTIPNDEYEIQLIMKQFINKILETRTQDIIEHPNESLEDLVSIQQGFVKCLDNITKDFTNPLDDHLQNENLNPQGYTSPPLVTFEMDASHNTESQTWDVAHD